MLDLIFCVLVIIILVKANKGVVNDTLCDVALVFGVLAGILGMVQALFIKGNNMLGLLNLLIMLMAFLVKRVAQHFAKLHNQEIEAIEKRYNDYKRLHSREGDKKSYSDTDFDDPNVRFGGGSGDNWNGK